VMLDPQQAERHERDEVGHIREPLVQQIVDQLSRVGRLGQVQDQQVKAMAKTPSMST
jgi:hypothetical protein